MKIREKLVKIRHNCPGLHLEKTLCDPEYRIIITK